MMQNLLDITKKIKEPTAYLLILGKSSGCVFHLDSVKGNTSIYSALWGRRKSRGVGWLPPDQPWICIFHNPNQSLIQLPQPAWGRQEQDGIPCIVQTLTFIFQNYQGVLCSRLFLSASLYFFWLVHCWLPYGSI